MSADGKPDSKWREGSGGKGGAGGEPPAGAVDEAYVDARDGGSDDEDDFEKYLHELSGSDQVWAPCSMHRVSPAAAVPLAISGAMHRSQGVLFAVPCP